MKYCRQMILAHDFLLHMGMKNDFNVTLPVDIFYYTEMEIINNSDRSMQLCAAKAFVKCAISCLT